MTGLFISGLSTQLGQERLSAIEAVELGSYTPENATSDGYISVSREAYRAPYEMALDAAELALAESGISVASLSAMVYASIHRHGQPRFWSPASWLQNKLDMSGATPVLSVQQGCNGLLQALVMLAPLCLSRTGGSLLLTGADRFEQSGFNRWQSDYGLIYGDAASAIVVSAEHGFARILHLAIDGVPTLELMHRHSQATAEDSESWVNEYDVRSSKKAFLSIHGLNGFTYPLNESLERLREGLLKSSHWTGSVDWVLTPFVGSKIRENTYERVFSDLGRQSGWKIGRHLGHLGTTDCWVGLSELRRSGALRPGMRVLAVSAGVGFSCGVCLIEML